MASHFVPCAICRSSIRVTSGHDPDPPLCSDVCAVRFREIEAENAAQPKPVKAESKAKQK